MKNQNEFKTKKGERQHMTKKDFLTLRKTTREILDAHYTLNKINRHRQSSDLCKYNGYDKIYCINYYGKEIIVRQMVQEFDGVCKYSILYLENYKFRPHNIRYIQSIYDVASYKLGIVGGFVA